MRITKKWKVLLVAMAVSVVLTVISHFIWGYHSITGTVVDAETGQPIKGAVGVCVWTTAGGLIEVTHSIAAVREGVSDKNGRIKIKGSWKLGLDAPELLIYKRGYVAWNNNRLFHVPEELLREMKYESSADRINQRFELFRRKDFSWKSGFVAKMEKWKDGYSFNELMSFISNHGGGGRFYDSLMEWKTSLQPHDKDRVGKDNSQKDRP